MANTNAAGIKYLDDQGSSGTVLGKDAADKIGFLGATPIAQKSIGTYSSGNTSALIASLISLTLQHSAVLKSFGFAS